MNFQNIPRGNKSIKAAFRPKLDLLVFADYSQIEYRLLAYYLASVLGDTSIADAYKAGMDAHTATARMLFNIPADEPVPDRQRQLGKNANFSLIYLGGVPSIMKYGDCDEATAKDLLQRIRAKMPGVQELFKEIKKTYHQRGYITTIAGRHLMIDPKVVEARGANRAEAALMNYVIQGSAAELIRDALIKIHHFLEANDMASHLVNVVHDEAQIDAIEPELPVLVATIPALMGNETVEEFVPIEVDIEVSRTTWAEKGPLDEASYA